MFESVQASDRRLLNDRRLTFRWNGRDFIVEAKPLANAKRRPGQGLGIGFAVNADLAVGMGWLNRQKTFLGKNVSYHLTDGKAVKNTELAGNDLWQVEDDGQTLRLSMTVFWVFSNLNEAFAEFVGSPSRRFFVYTDLVESNRMGGQRHPLIREVYFPKNGEGIQYFEPLHLQWMALRRPWMDTIQVQLADPTGTLAKFQGGQTVVTFSFRKGTV